MRCPNCKGSLSVYNFIKEKHCPACGAVLKRAPTKEQVRDFLVWLAEDKGHIFWGINYWIAGWVVALFELGFGQGLVFDYITQHWFRFLLWSAYAGMIISFVAKANVEVTAVRNKYIFKPPRYLRAFRRWTNIAAVLGVGLAAYVVYRWPNYLSPVTIVTFVPSFPIASAWALMGLFLLEEDLNDKRIRYFFDEMRVRRAKYYHRASAIFIGGFFIASLIYYNLVRISGLWFYIWNSRIVYDVNTFFKQYFGWVKHFVR